jgi:hypothetical protein
MGFDKLSPSGKVKTRNAILRIADVLSRRLTMNNRIDCVQYAQGPRQMEEQ